MSSHRGLNGYHSNSIASSSANPYPDFSQSIPSPTQNHWSPMPSQNSHPHPQMQQQQHYNQPHWIDQMHRQQFSNNGMQAMAGFNMPFIPQQVLHDALAMSAPVGAADEPILIQALLGSRPRGETYKDALNSLHGKSGHSASLWKDYYLDHKYRLDEYINLCVNPSKPPIKTAKKPSPASFKVESSPRLPFPAPVSSGQQKQLPKLPQPAKLPQPSGSRRSTINSLTTHTPVYDDHLPPPNSEVKVPDPPSRSPSPPTKIISHNGRGNKYTSEDRVFFLKFIAWRLQGDPTLTRNELCLQLAAKAPHHTAQSWASYWSNHHDIPDKILAAAKGDESVEPNSEAGGGRLIVRRPKYCELSSDESESESEPEPEPESEPEDDDDDDDDLSVRAWDESDMGTRGGAFTDADLYVTAKHVASFLNFKEVSNKDKWASYSQRFPQRSDKSWAEYYRRNERTIDKLAQKIRKINKQRHPISSIQSQLGRPTWAAPEEIGRTNVKRKYKVDNNKDADEGDANHSKRGRRPSDNA